LNASKLASAAGLALAATLTHAATIHPYTAKTAPDALSKRILTHRHASIEEGAAGPADVHQAIHRNFGSVIEQNLAQMPAKSMAAWLDGMEDAELRDLAQLYVDANADARRKGSALHVFATRLDGKRLARLGRFFGYHEMNAAVLEVAPLKAHPLAAATTIAQAAPVPHAALAGRPTPGSLQPLAGGAMPLGGARPAPNVEMSIYEIYMDFRTAPVGSLSARAAIYETAMFAGSRLISAGYAGYWL
jgi:hypothetical protein